MWIPFNHSFYGMFICGALIVNWRLVLYYYCAFCWIYLFNFEYCFYNLQAQDGNIRFSWTNVHSWWSTDSSWKCTKQCLPIRSQEALLLPSYSCFWYLTAVVAWCDRLYFSYKSTFWLGKLYFMLLKIGEYFKGSSQLPTSQQFAMYVVLFRPFSKGNVGHI